MQKNKNKQDIHNLPVKLNNGYKYSNCTVKN